ncbi:MAG TPA: 50S ribosomal protein L32 [Thermodesulfobacteriota bacterium]|nr:50S ribosomal protein L32 [Deltaproteobacteria bacterium]HNR12635.1 50S ribosomal protein L32 [Thermodesulfobacteriota bacterium]HNU71164.1 50S ribosomal protein L32 [Thermodesulfobacteriota bacterium]HOC38418.1 50S ribosomal protein L32 [Thermodesulfobacteriota bacterium]HQO77109.1 50S ribosomal protein L32 [Thermodesulfobacteriota bacterium]
MALPPKRHSKSRGRKRRTHDKTTPPTLITCSHCGEKKLPHHACPSCGYYKDREVIEVEES